MATAPSLRRRLRDGLRDASVGVILDMIEVDFVDSSALGAMIICNQEAEDSGRQVPIVAPRGSAAAFALTLTGLCRRLAVFESHHAASYGRIGERNLQRLLDRDLGLVGLGPPPPGAARIHRPAGAEPAWLHRRRRGLTRVVSGAAGR